MLNKSILVLSLLLAKNLLLTSATFLPTNYEASVRCGQTVRVAQVPYNVKETANYPAFYQPELTYRTFDEGLDIPSSFIKDSLQATALTIVQDALGLSDGDVMYTSGYSGETADYAYLNQMHNNIPFVNSVANLVIKSGNIVSFGHSFVKPKHIAYYKPSKTVRDAVHAAERIFPGSYNEFPAKLEYYVKEDGNAVLVHTVQIQGEDTWFEVYVDAHTNEVVGATDYVAHSGYLAVPISKQSILEGQKDIKDPEDFEASPFGWNSEGINKGGNTTAGNNAISFHLKESSVTKANGDGLTFNYPYDTSVGPKDKSNLDAARVNAFYVINSVHDLAYRYGFTEKAFNFQANNFGKGGKEHDRVLIQVQSVEGTTTVNNANFATPADGQSGTCRMYVWNLNNKEDDVFRDGDLDNSVIVHEMTHGITNRMTGGGTARCLAVPESRQLGEGWADIMADWTEQNSTYTTDFTIGRYATGNPNGTRASPYSTNPETNKLRYSHVNLSPAAHQGGQVWANMLHNVYAGLVEKHGYDPKARTNPDSKKGNAVFLHLFLDSLSVQPCNPGFINSRDAWIQADKNRYNGENKCLLWKQFASRGLGIDAKRVPQHTDGFDVPADCK